MSRAEAALALFEQGRNCAQAVCGAFADEQDLPAEACFALAAPFGAGMGREGEVCGAVSGALLVLGVRHGRGPGEPAQVKERVYERVQRTLDAFKARHGTLRCRELIGEDLRTPEGRQRASERDVHHRVCAGLVRELVEELERCR